MSVTVTESVNGTSFKNPQHQSEHEKKMEIRLHEMSAEQRRLVVRAGSCYAMIGQSPFEGRDLAKGQLECTLKIKTRICN